MAFDEAFGGELSEEQIFFRQILTISSLATRIYTDTTTEWQVNVRNYVEAIKTFESIAIRHLDSEYKGKMMKIINSSRDKVLKYRKDNPAYSYTNMGKEYEVIVTLDVARKRLALIIKMLGDKGVFGEKSYRAIQSKPGGEDDEEVVAIE